LFIYNQSINQYNDILLRQNKIEYLSLQAQDSFKRQVQEWKNILLRGENSRDYERYHASFIDQFEKTQIISDTLRNNIEEQSPAFLLINEFIDKHKSVLSEYQVALMIFKESDFNTQLADEVVRGIDREPDLILDKVSNIIKSETNAARANIEIKTNYIKVFLGFSFLILQIIFCFVTLHLTKKLLRSTLKDKVSGLNNRDVFIQTIKDNLTHEQSTVVVVLDIDEFKIINETCGNLGGNEYLAQIARLLTNTCHPDDCIARLSGDEFGIIINIDEKNDYLSKLSLISKSVATTPFEYGELSTSLSCCVSYIELNSQTTEASTEAVEDLLNSLHVTMQHAKETGRGSILKYSPTDETLSSRKEQMRAVTTITNALETQRILLYKQAINPIQNNKTKYYEVLIRIKNNDGSISSPWLFLQAAERFHLITKIDRYVLKNTFKFMSQNPDEALSVNLSGQTLSDSTFIEFCEILFNKAKVDLSRLGFEVTESDFIRNFETANKNLDYLRSKGCKVSLDDFGTGMSSFAYIADLKLHTIKIDGTFIKELNASIHNQAIVKSIVQLCKDLKLSTVAEFVETQEEYKMIKALGIDYAQGYLLHKPELFYSPSEHNHLPN
jgi:diguanylate cyclase (GGDEF)-like protein